MPRGVVLFPLVWVNSVQERKLHARRALVETRVREGNLTDPSGNATTSSPHRKSLGPTTKVLLALGLGAAVGLFFGEYTAWLKVFGDIFVGLLQMTVLPYITASLIASIGRLTWSEGRRMMGTGAIVLVGLWILGLGFVVLAPMALPHWETGSFFTPSMLENPPQVDFIDRVVARSSAIPRDTKL